MNTDLRKKWAVKRAILPFVFLVWLSWPVLAAEEVPCRWSGVEKIVVVGDLHGDYDHFVQILKAVGLVDSNLSWTGGRAFLVQTGDVMDRGPEARKIFDLIRRLEDEAEAAGGQVQMLIGNHEEMNITGIAFDYEDYVTVEQFISFLPEDYFARKQKELEKKARRGRDINRLWQEVMDFDLNARRKYLVYFNQNYGRWIARHNAVIKINDIVFVHGGISEEFSGWTIEAINDRLRHELSVFQKALLNFSPPASLKLEIVYNANGPLWYRQLALANGRVSEEQVDRILSNLEARHIIVAHTPQLVLTINDMRRFEGKVWVVDTGISRAYGGYLRALIINDGQFSLWGVNHEKK